MLDISVQDQLRPYLEKLKPRPSIYCPDFIAANQVGERKTVRDSSQLTMCYDVSVELLFLSSPPFQSDRADNVLSGTKWEMVTKVRDDIKDFKQKKNLDKVPN